MAVARDALAPFAKEAAFFDKCQPSRPLWALAESWSLYSRQNNETVCVKDFRVAREALTVIRNQLAGG